MATSTLGAHTPRRAAAFGDLELAPMTQAAAMVGLGLVYEGSGHWGTSEMLLHEISRRPETPSVRCRKPLLLAPSWVPRPLAPMAGSL